MTGGINEEWCGLCQALCDGIHVEEQHVLEVQGVEAGGLGLSAKEGAKESRLCVNCTSEKLEEPHCSTTVVEDMVTSRRRVIREMWDARITDLAYALELALRSVEMVNVEREKDFVEAAVTTAV